jgi:gentisate 1,2-dioxygenase
LIHSKASRVQPFQWRWADIEPRLRASPQFAASGNGAERHVLRLANPGVPERTSSHTLSAAVEYLLPGETAPAHRHTPNALRFVLSGTGGYTVVDGHKCVMAPGDLVLSPSMTWHEHGNDGTEPVMWLDGLDAPLVGYLEILKMEPGEESAAANRVARRVPRTVHYKWDDAYSRLLKQAETAANPFDDVIVEYHDPVNGASVLPTIGCYLQMIRRGVETRAHSQTSTAIYQVVRGSGVTTIGEARYDWDAGDFFIVPPNLPHAHAQRGSEPAILFSMQDVPLLEALGLYVESPFGPA